MKSIKMFLIVVLFISFDFHCQAFAELSPTYAIVDLTIFPVQIVGIDDKVGSLEKGKIANIVLADGDILEMRTNIKHVFIDGKEADLSSVYTDLLDKFKNRNN